MITWLRKHSHLVIGALMVLVSFEKYLTGDFTLSQFLTTVQGLVGFSGISVAALGDVLKHQ